MKLNTIKKTTLIAITLILAMTMCIATIPIGTAHTPPQTYPTYAYLTIAPDPIGVGQPVYIIMWVSPNPPTASGLGGDVWRDFTLTITKPDGNIDTLGPFNSDATGSTFTSYAPDQTGVYKVEFNYPGQVLSLYGPNGIPSDLASLQTLSARLGLPDKTQYIGDTFEASSKTQYLTVQDQPIAKIPETPLPTSFWTRPIYGQNSAWASIASNWLSGSQIGGTGILAQAGAGPNSPHILWTKPIEMGGIVGAQTALGVNTYAIPDVGYYSGGSYEGRFASSMIINGRLFYSNPLGHSATGAGYTCVDLKTGEVLWHSDDIAVTTNGLPGVGPVTPLVPTFGQIYDYESQNQHGVVGALLWAITSTGATSTWSAYDAFTGKWVFNETNVPGGYTAYTATGAIVKYILNYNKNTKSGWLALWNNTQHNSGLELAAGGGNESQAATTEAYQWRPNGKSVDMGTPFAYSWNVSINADLSGLGNPTIVKVLPGDIILGTSTPAIAGFFSVGVDVTPKPYTIWAISDNPSNRGQLLWIKNDTAPTGITRTFSGSSPVDTVNRVFFLQDTETFAWSGYSLDTGDLLWGPTAYATHDFSYYGSGLGGGQIGWTGYGNLYTQGFGGEICAINGATGALAWKFNNTNSGDETVWGYYPIFIGAIADGKVYAFNNEHSPNYPLYKGEQIYCIDAYSGNEIYRMLSWAGQSGGPGTETTILADGVLCYYNYYDNSIYAIGQGPSQTTVSASPGVGNAVTIQGTVTDISAGAKQLVDSGKFNIVPAVSDGSMNHWMEYLYMQQPCPASVDGVQVKLQAVASDGSATDIGTVKTDGNGQFVASWTPQNNGVYTITATFDMTNGYYGSYAETGITVQAASSSGGGSTTTEQGGVTTIDWVIIVAVVIAIIIGLVNLFIVRSRKP